MRSAAQEKAKIFTHEEWQSVLAQLKVLIDGIEDKTCKEKRNRQLELIKKEMDLLSKYHPSIHGDSYIIQMHSLQTLHNALKEQDDDRKPLAFLQDFINIFLKNNPKELKGVNNEDIKNGHYEIPFGVTAIGDMAFIGCTSLTTLTIPQGVTAIGDMAFEGCTSLTTLTIPQSVTVIGNGAFFCCERLTNLTIPQGVTAIYPSTFAFCAGLTTLTIPQSVTNIDHYGLYRCTGLTALTIPQGMTAIGNSAFSGCTGLSSIKIEASNEAGYQLTLKLLPNELQVIAENTRKNQFIDNALLIKAAVASTGEHTFFNDMPTEIAAKIIGDGGRLLNLNEINEIDVIKKLKM